ncbi:MAG: translocation/assembly module TamB domain-containing protein [Leptolyngbyaceae cyanobacterium]
MSGTPSEEPTSENRRNRRRIWATAGLTLGAIATLGIAGGAWWAWIFVNERLSPWLSELLTDAIDRPVALGEVERVSLTRIRLGPSAVPATEADPDTLYVEAIEVRFNILQLLGRRIRPQINLIGAQGYLEQNAEGQWLDVTLDLGDDEADTDPLIQVHPTIGIQDSEVALLPYVGEDADPLPLTIAQINGTVALEQVDIDDPLNQGTLVEAQEIRLDLSAEPENAGRFEVDGTIYQIDYDEATVNNALDTLDANLAIRGQQADLALLAPVLPVDLPFTILSGTLNGNVELDLTPRAEPQLTGTTRVEAGAIAFEELPEPINNIEGQIRFQGNRLELENARAQFVNLAATAEGEIDSRNGYNITGQIAPFDVAELTDVFDLDLPVDVTGTAAADVSLTGALADPNVTAMLTSTDVLTVDRVQFDRVVAELTYVQEALILASLDATPSVGGSLTGSGIYTFSEPTELSLQLVGRDLPADAIGRAYGLPDTITLGSVALDADVSGPLNNLSGVISWQAPGGTYPTRGTAEVVASTVRVREAVVAVAGGTISGSGTLIRRQWDADLVAQGIQLGAFEESLEGAIAGGNVQLSGTLDDLTLNGIRADGDVTASLQGGTLDSQIALLNGNWNANVQTRNFPITQFTPGLTIPITDFAADARLSGTVDDLTLAGIRGEGTVTATVAGGAATSDIFLENGLWQAEGQGNNLQLAQIASDLQGTGSATFQLEGTLDNLSPTGIRGRANIALSDGLATLASLSPQLASVRSPLDANVEWDGRILQVNQLATAGLSANGTITPLLSGPEAPGIASIDLAIAAQDYALSALPIDIPPALALTGQATFDGRLAGTPSDLTLVGDLSLANLALNDLVFDPLLAGDVRFSSQEGLDVELLGQQDEIVVTYDLDPRQLNFRIQADEAIAIGRTEGNLLQTQIEKFPISALNIPPDESNPYGPIRGTASAVATIDLEDLSTVGFLDVRNLGVGYFTIDRVVGGIAYANGIASVNNGEIFISDRNSRGEAIATRTYNLSGRYALTGAPQIQAAISTEEGQLRDILTVLKVSEIADFQRGFIPQEGLIPTSQAEAERFLPTTPAGDPNGTLLSQLRRLSEIMELRVQQELQAETAALPPLEDLQGAFRGEVNLAATLPDDIVASFDIEGDSWTWGPDLSADTVLAQGSYQNGVIFFDPLRFETAAVDGQPAFVELAGDFSLDPEGQRDREMMLTVANLPAETVQGLANLPFDLGGRLNGTATLRGRFVDPTLVSNVELVNGTLNREPIDRAAAILTYDQGRVGLDADLTLLDSDDPLTVSAQVPARLLNLDLPFIEAVSPDESYAISANVKDEGFALLNLFTQEVAWESGEGELTLNVEGSLDEEGPREFDGLVLLDGATLSFDALPAPMTDVRGRIRLVLDAGDVFQNPKIVVDSLTGQFSEGDLMAQGSFPIVVPLPTAEAAQNTTPADADSTAAGPAEESAPVEASSPTEATTDEAVEDPNPATVPDVEVDPDTLVPTNPTLVTQVPLTLDVNNVDLDLKGLYNGQVNGQMVLAGSLLTGPALTGEIDLSNGIITIPEGSNATVDFSDITSQNDGGLQLPPLQFDNLRIILVRNIRIIEGALLNVAANGGLRLDGTIANLRPTGTIGLPSGRVELFATSLRLAGENDRAEFRGDFDPILDVTLQTALPDASGSAGIEPTTSPFPENEVPDGNIEGLGLTQQGNGLVRINARYTGPASELSSLQTDLSNLELTSSPPRSNNELVALLSRNVLGAFDSLQGDGALTGLATFAGSAVLERIRDFLGDTIPLSEFRIFQANEGSGQVNDSQDIGAEIGVDVRPNISVSVLKVLTNETPFQFNVRYRINNQFTLRGTTSFEDFSDRTGVLLEYETRF